MKHEHYTDGCWTFWPKAGLADAYKNGTCYDTAEEALAQADWPVKARPKGHYRLVRLHRVTMTDVMRDAFGWVLTGNTPDGLATAMAKLGVALTERWVAAEEREIADVPEEVPLANRADAITALELVTHLHAILRDNDSFQNTRKELIDYLAEVIDDADKSGAAEEREIEPAPQSTRGLYEKFSIVRNDGESDPGKKHHGCRYFVLDMDHDPHAAPAMLAYAHSCKHDYPKLSADIVSEMLGEETEWLRGQPRLGIASHEPGTPWPERSTSPSERPIEPAAPHEPHWTDVAERLAETMRNDPLLSRLLSAWEKCSEESRSTLAQMAECMPGQEGA